MSDTLTIILGDVERYDGTSKSSGKAFTKFTLKDGNAQVVGATFEPPLGDASRALIGQRVEVDVEPSSDPKYAPKVTAVRPAPEETSNGGSDTTLSKDEWLLKDLAGDKRACIAIAAGVIGHTFRADQLEEHGHKYLDHFAGNVLYLAERFLGAVKRERGLDPDRDIPF